jgi:hypothetical protein
METNPILIHLCKLADLHLQTTDARNKYAGYRKKRIKRVLGTQEYPNNGKGPNYWLESLRETK